MKNSSDINGNQTRNLPVCSAVSQSIASPLAPSPQIRLLINHFAPDFFLILAHPVYKCE